jgi:hypothetical protein
VNQLYCPATVKRSSKAPAKRKAKAPARPKRPAKASKKVAPPNANELQHWRFMAVPAGTTPDALTDRSIARALDDLVASGVDAHELLAWTASDDHTMLDDDDRGGFTTHGDRRTARVVHFAGRPALRAGLGAMAITGKLSSLPSDVGAGWAAARRDNGDGAELRFYACELLVLGDRPELETAWKTGNVAAWRYALALAQDRPLMAKLWHARMSDADKAVVTAPTAQRRR